MTAPSPATAFASERDAQGSLALDQWRGLALLVVLVSHGFYFTNHVNGLGRVGVNLFFFISGILVFRTLSRLRAANHWGLVRTFWWRRLRRLYPAMIVYMLILLPAMWWLQRLPDLPMNSTFAGCLRSFWQPMFYVVNYGGTCMCYGHLWSLACEMQFYLLAPLIFLAGGTSHRRRTIFWGFILAVLLVTGVAKPVFPMLGWQFESRWDYRFEIAAWPMMAGFICEYRRDWISRLPGRLVSVVVWASLLFSAGGFALMIAGFEVKSLVIAVGASLLIPCLLAYLHGRPWHGWHGRSLRWLGERTYSIYLWQQPFTVCDFLPHFLEPVGALVAIWVGAVSFRFLEYPFLSVNRQKQEKSRAGA